MIPANGILMLMKKQIIKIEMRPLKFKIYNILIIQVFINNVVKLDKKIT